MDGSGHKYLLQNDTPPPSPQAPSPEASKAALSRRRLPPAGAQILDDFWNRVSQTPTLSQRADLLRELHGIPDCGWYSKASLDRWFNNRRRSASKHDPLVTVQHTLFPSFQTKTYSQLEGLIREDPNPAHETIDVWAAALKINPVELGRWILWHRVRKDQNLNTNGATQTPTSLSSPISPISPTGPCFVPGSSSISAQLPPRIAVNVPAPRATSHLPTPQSTVSPEPTPKLAPAVIRQIPDSIRRARDLAAVVQDELATQKETPRRIPQTLAEFNEAFAPHETRMKSFMNHVTDGEYERIGLKASYAKPVV